MEMILTYWRDDLAGPGTREVTLEQQFRGLDPDIAPEFQDDTLKLSFAVDDGPEGLEEWVSLYLDFGTVEEFDKWVGQLRDGLTRMLPDKEEAPELLPEG